MKKKMVIGVLGGMGTYATINLFSMYASIFSAEKEWDRPRIVIDNRCTMPSRVRAYLFGEKTDELISEMIDALNKLQDAGCTKIIIACNTAHIFLPQIYTQIMDIENKILNIVSNCVEVLVEQDVRNVYLLGSEGTIESGIYQDALEKNGIECAVPTKEEYSLIRDCIEAVKRNCYSKEIKGKFLNLVNRNNFCVLGCTELPILYELYKSEVDCENVFDPLELAMRKLKEEYAAYE